MLWLLKNRCYKLFLDETADIAEDIVADLMNASVFFRNGYKFFRSDKTGLFIDNTHQSFRAGEVAGSDIIWRGTARGLISMSDYMVANWYWFAIGLLV